MNILLLGSGGREHALAWKLAQSPRCTALYTLPGNPGTAQHGHNLPGEPTDRESVLQAAHQVRADLVVIGPEAPLAAGVSDALRSEGFLVFGPSQAAAQIEASKAFAKAFMDRHGIPTAQALTCSTMEEALKALQIHDPRQVVLKASGLAAGKGVFLPQNRGEAETWLREVLVDGRFGNAGAQVLIETRLQGPEVSVLAFSDGKQIAIMPPAQDHKRLYEGNRGPNTGGMGAFAPSPLCPPDLLETIRTTILQPTIEGLRSEGRPFVGVLYAGLMLTPQGPQVLEFNCRFGDPETQAILPLLESDLPQICLACAQGDLASLPEPIRWRPEAAVNVVLASAGYPGKYPKGLPISGVEAHPKGGVIFFAGVDSTPEGLVTSGGRVLSVTCLGENLSAARESVYAAVAKIHFEGLHYRRDIASIPSAYSTAGVDIEAGNRAVGLMKSAVRSTFTPAVLSDLGTFGGLFSAAELQAMSEPVLVASTDGVGTKVALAAHFGRYRGIGHDIVNHCVNDILVQGARPLFFLDYIASDRLVPQEVAEMVDGMAAACRENGCALLGGETAEMPGVYAPGHFDVAGTIVGVVPRENILPQADLAPGDVLVGLTSSGAHTNGYSLLRRVLSPYLENPEAIESQLGKPLADVLLAPHRSYLTLLAPLLGHVRSPKALVHITGGGFYDNLPRVLPTGLGVRVDVSTWPHPPLFEIVQRLGAVSPAEMYRVFNMGIGMVAILAPQDVAAFQAAIGEPTYVIGEVCATPGVVLHNKGIPLEAGA